MELSCLGNGVATRRPCGIVGEPRPADSLHGCRSPAGRGRGWRSRRALSMPSNRASCRSPDAGTASTQTRPRPDCRAGREPAWRRRGRTCSGLPGRMAIFQKSNSMPAVAERLLHEVVLADRGAAAGHQQIGARGGLRPSRCSTSQVVGRDAEMDRLGAAGRDEGGERQAVGADDLVSARSARRA